MTDNKIEFDIKAALNALREYAAKGLPARTEEDGVLTPLIKELTEAAPQ